MVVHGYMTHKLGLVVTFLNLRSGQGEKKGHFPFCLRSQTYTDYNYIKMKNR